MRYADGWDQGDADLIAAVLDGDRFVFNEPGNANLDKDAFIRLMQPYIGHPGVDSIDNQYFVGDDEIIEIYQAWGFGGTSEENPVVEVDVFTVHDGVITSIRSMYGSEFVSSRTGIEGAEEVVAAYESAWSSGDASEVRTLYADDAVRLQPLTGARSEGAEEIARDASERFARHPDLSVSVVDPYVFMSADTLAQTYGSMYTFGDGSTCKVLVLLELNEAGEITTERVYFDTATLGSCAH